MSHLTVEDLKVVFRNLAGEETTAVDGVSFALDRGTTLGIVGESGSGKSTVARALLGYARPGAKFAAGRVSLGLTKVLELSQAELRKFRGARAALVPQNPLSSLTPHLPVGDQLTELVRLHTPLRGKDARERAYDLMDETDLPQPRDLATRYPHEISGGQRQRVVIAAALIARPDLIVLDEPTTALDKTVEGRVLKLVSRVQQDLDATLVYVSHDLNVISAMCRQTLVMRHGEIVESGPTDTVFNRPSTDYARSLVAAIPALNYVSRRSPEENTPPVLAAKSIRFSYGEGKGLFFLRKGAPLAVNDISFDVRKGETLGVVGESGSGKSTLASLIAGSIAGYDGEIRLTGEILKGAARMRPADQRRRIQMVFQDPLSSLNPAHTIEEILVRPLRLYFGETAASAREKAVGLLKELELGPDLLARRPRQLSGGQQQRVAIARALAAEPDLLICDEITSALDVTIQAQVLELLKTLQDSRGIACIFISHDLAVISEFAHKVLVMERGQMREIGPKATVLGSPTSPYTERLLNAYKANQRSAADPILATGS